MEWRFTNVDEAYKRLVELALSIPRTVAIEETNNYWHGVCRSLIFRFPDDLEILKISREGIIQIKSSSRIGASDFGVNQNRINNLYQKLIKKNENIKLKNK